MIRTKRMNRLIAVGMAVLLVLVTACSESNSNEQARSVSSLEPGSEIITVSVMTSNRFMELAKTKYELLHPGTKVQIKEYVPAEPDAEIIAFRSGSTPNPADVTTYVNGVNTELMSGKASDLIMTDHLPYQKYVDKKLIENLTERMKDDPDFDSSQYYSSVFDAMKYKDGLFSLPVNISLKIMLGNEELLSGAKEDNASLTWESWKDEADAIVQNLRKSGGAESFAFTNMQVTDLFDHIFRSKYNEFVNKIDKQASFDSEPFTDLLKFCKWLYDTKLVTEQKLKRDSTTLFHMSSVMMYEELFLLPRGIFDQAAVYPIPELKGTSVTPELQFALNRKSKIKDAAWDFLKFLISYDMQAAHQLMGLPVNKSASSKRGEELLQTNPSDWSIVNDEGTPVIPEPFVQDNPDFLEFFLNGAIYYAGIDDTVMSIVKEGAAPFFAGQKSAEDVSSNIQSKVNTYLNE